mmetsp:Transcript_28723/g.52492  ORF Transcript_28723/g.52492 Transcript_28723/m.52492 type:complete len:222 (-) Transcript_28723:2047-2712(-)
MHSLAPGFLLGSFFVPTAPGALLLLEAMALLAAAAALRSATYMPACLVEWCCNGCTANAAATSLSVRARFMSPPPSTSSWKTVRWIFRPERLRSTAKSGASMYTLDVEISDLAGSLRGMGALPSLRGRPRPRLIGGCCPPSVAAAAACCCRRSWACILASVSLLGGRPGPLFRVIRSVATTTGSLVFVGAAAARLAARSSASFFSFFFAARVSASFFLRFS